MIVDADTEKREAFAQSFDVCVIGAGPAGITVARQLSGHGLKIALMEAGGLEPTPESQDHYEGEIVGLDYFPLSVTRLRFFGGSSNHWQGWCRALPAHDFEPRSGDPWSGWPIRKADLDPYQRDADAILELPPAEDFAYFELEGAKQALQGFTMRRSFPQVRFGEKFREEIAASESIILGLNANLIDLRLEEATGNLDRALFRGYQEGDPGFEIQARSFVLCLGGLENPRALLNANSQREAGLGNEHDLVGRFFCEHPHYEVGEILLQRPFEHTAIAPTPEMMRAEEILNCAMVILPPPPVEELNFFKEAVRSVPCSTDFTERLAEQVLGRSLHCEEKGLDAYREQQNRPPVDALLLIRSEQALTPDSRVRLSEERDAFGQRRIALDWRLSDVDYHTMRTASLAVGSYLAEQEIGRLRVVDWLLDKPPQVPPFPEAETGGHHHLCTTRMADDPRRGVVDANCRVHSVSNLYVGGSSTFGTGGWVNPTYTIVQLALRLGDHVAAELTRT